MCKREVNIQTRARNYDASEFGSKGKEVSTSEMPNPLHIDKPANDTMPRIPKGVLKRSTHNPNARAAQNYSIV